MFHLIVENIRNFTRAEYSSQESKYPPYIVLTQMLYNQNQNRNTGYLVDIIGDKLSTPRGFNINVRVPNLVRQMRISV